MNNSLLNYFKKSDGTPLRATPGKNTSAKNTPATKLAKSVEKKLKVDDKENAPTPEKATAKKKLNIKAGPPKMDTDDIDDDEPVPASKNKKRVSNESLRDDDEDMPKMTKRRKVMVIESDESGGEESYVPAKKVKDEDYQMDSDKSEDEQEKPKVCTECDHIDIQ
jgi:hypothetical protein